jgi:two-component system, NarL family, sensor kinase
MWHRSRRIAESEPATEAVSPARATVYRGILDTLEVGVAQVSSTGCLLYANPSFLHTLGITRKFQPGQTSLKEVVSASSWADIDAALLQSIRGPVEGEMKIELEGRSRSLHLTFTPMHFTHEVTIRIVAVEVTELIKANTALEASKKSLQALSARILRLQDDERRHIARDLHDITGQELAVVSMSLGHLANSIDRPGLDVRKAIEDATTLVRKVEDEVRTLSYVLHPPLLDELGLVAALDWYVEGFSKRTGIQVHLDAPKDVPRLPAEREIGMFRVVQESLTNVLRHSGSKTAYVTLSVRSSFIQLSVADEGKGIPSRILNNINAGKGRLGVGLPGMRERIKQLEGTMEIVSRKCGTEIIATLPLREGEAAPAVGMTPAAAARSGHRGRAAAKRAPRPRRARILIADDHEVARIGLRTLLSREPDLEICGEAVDGAEAVAQVERLRPDLVILDLIMPRMGGFSAIHRLHEMGMDSKILVFTTHFYPQLERILRASECDGCLLKSNVSTDLLRAVRAVLAGKRFFPMSEESPEERKNSAPAPVRVPGTSPAFRRK